MSTSNDIIGKCRASIKTRLPRPRLSDIDATEYIEPLEEFIRQAQDAGCRIVQVDNAAETDRIIKETYPDAKRIASALPIVKCANLNPDTIPDPHELNDTDVGVVEGKFGVAENGAIWITQDVVERDVYFISENLVILLQKDQIVSNMHQAYGVVTFNNYGYGLFMAGPSKTADIAQVLVMGAQAARSVTVVLYNHPATPIES